VIEEDMVVSRKRPRQFPAPVPTPEPAPRNTVATLRRSTRSKRFQGFKQNAVSDKPTHKTHVKSRHVPGKKVATSKKGKEISIHATNTEDPTMKPTPVHFLQHVGAGICGIPAIELTDEQLMVPCADVDVTAKEAQSPEA